MLRTMTRTAFSYWSDPLCIWAYVAQDKLDRVLDELGDRLRVDYRIVPVFGSVPWRFREGPWAAGGVEDRVRKTRQVAEAHGYPAVTGEYWRRDCPESSWSAGAALKAVFAAEAAESIPPGKGADYQWHMRRVFFEQDRNVARRQVQLELAEERGVPRAELEQRLDDGTALAALWEDYLEKERLHVQGSPTYVFDGGHAMLYGNFPFGILHATVEELVRSTGPRGSKC
jgi:predicted DsbA family dithiol-disulfide isomerase